MEVSYQFHSDIIRDNWKTVSVASWPGLATGAHFRESWRCHLSAGSERVGQEGACLARSGPPRSKPCGLPDVTDPLPKINPEVVHTGKGSWDLTVCGGEVTV